MKLDVANPATWIVYVRLFLLVFLAGIQVAFACLGVRLEGVFERFGLLESLEEDHLSGSSMGTVSLKPWKGWSYY